MVTSAMFTKRRPTQLPALVCVLCGEVGFSQRGATPFALRLADEDWELSDGLTAGIRPAGQCAHLEAQRSHG